jgi:hypothetical protein
MKKDVLNFKDFLKDSVVENQDSFDELENDYVNFEEDDEEDISTGDDEDDEISDLELTSERLNYLMNDFELSEDELSSIKEMTSDNSDYYQLYKDVNENFVCDIFIEGAKIEDSKVRLVLESKEWNLIFNGYIENGKCYIPIKKLDILNEDITGEIKLEIIAEGNVFVPWCDKFIVKSTKKVKTLNENIKKDIDVKVGRVR